MWILSEWHALTESISKVHDEPIFLPESFIKGSLLPAIVVVTICLTIFYLACFSFVDKIAPTNATKEYKIKICYQITNVCFNIVIGCVGLYLEYVVLPSLDVYGGASADKIVGLEQELYLVSAMQLGYQFWAIPVGILHVKESVEMIVHHFAVVVSTSMTGFLSIGFRYYSPFFYGVMELSSVPLSIMNVFRDSPELQKKYPTANASSRIIFAASFLIIRVIMCLSRWPFFLRDNFVVFYTKEMGAYKLYMFLQWSLATFLAILQLYWATLIFKGMLKMTSGSGGKNKPKQT
jgi:hypothetical protein